MGMPGPGGERAGRVDAIPRSRSDRQEQADPQARVRQEQLRLLARNLHVVLPGSLVIAGLMTWGIGDRAGSLPAVSWFLFLLTLVGVRILLARRALKLAEHEHDYRQLKLVLLGGAFLSGVTWGVAGVLFFDPAQPQDYALLVIVLGGVVAGSMGPHSYYFPNYALFVIPVMTPLLALFFLQEQEVFRLIGVAMLLFLFINLFYSKQYEEMVVKSIRLQFSNEGLLAELRRSNEQLHHYSYTDSLTGIGNRRRFDLDFENSWEKAQRAGQSLSLLLLDVDHFKAYNDRHGHASGDQVLRNIAGILTDVCQDVPACGSPARIGGEEFAVLLHCDESRAAEVSETICRQIEARMARQGTGVTASIGVATRIPEAASRPEQLFRNADENLYAAKAAGRNCVISG